MKGTVDGSMRALISVDVKTSLNSRGEQVEAWIDTAFDGHFVFSSGLIKELDLDTLVETEAVLADGSKVVLQTYVCFIEWFGEKIAAQVVANEGRFPLLGTALLAGRLLRIDYDAKTVELV